MNGRERIMQALHREAPDRVPTFEWFIDPTVGQALVGSDDILDVVDQLDLDAVNVRPDYGKEFLDETTYIDEWGTTRQLTGDILPAVRSHPIEDVTRQREYHFPETDSPERFGSLEKALDRFGDQRAVILNLRDGFSDVRDLLGYEQALMAMLLEPEHFGSLLARSVEYNLRLAQVARDRYGIEIVATTDDVANAQGLLMRPETYFERIAPLFQQVIHGYKELGLACIKHCDGNIDAVVDFWIDCEIDCLDPIDPAGGYTLGSMKKKYGDRVCLKGNVDCMGALCNGTEEDVAAEVKQCLDEAGTVGLILSSSNTIHRGVKPENYRAMVDAVHRYATP